MPTPLEEIEVPAAPESTGETPSPPVVDLPKGAEAAESPTSSIDGPALLVRRELSPVALSKSNGR